MHTYIPTYLPLTIVRFRSFESVAFKCFQVLAMDSSRARTVDDKVCMYVCMYACSAAEFFGFVASLLVYVCMYV